MSPLTPLPVCLSLSQKKKKLGCQEPSRLETTAPPAPPPGQGVRARGPVGTQVRAERSWDHVAEGTSGPELGFTPSRAGGLPGAWWRPTRVLPGNLSQPERHGPPRQSRLEHGFADMKRQVSPSEASQAEGTRSSRLGFSDPDAGRLASGAPAPLCRPHPLDDGTVIGTLKGSHARILCSWGGAGPELRLPAGASSGRGGRCTLSPQGQAEAPGSARGPEVRFLCPGPETDVTLRPALSRGWAGDPGKAWWVWGFRQGCRDRGPQHLRHDPAETRPGCQGSRWPSESRVPTSHRRPPVLQEQRPPEGPLRPRRPGLLLAEAAASTGAPTSGAPAGFCTRKVMSAPCWREWESTVRSG